ncbi:RDD family protein [Glycomyces harbinensis]|uniref:RDD family protein n=1 Tax=Glycomyces harbinensis TaxID=58114 RepID=A0A1G6SUP2_9ACTN|nr:RDD family protein [Glycomyces harbinensis]SDD19917.1 RDD family protein [Glycomyces harbinensis]
MTTERGAKTPETPGAGQDLAPLIGRFVAVLIDWIACLALAYLIGWATGLRIEFADVNQAPAGLFLLYYSFSLAVGTQTLGMTAMRITCVSATDGGRLVLWRSILRALLLSLVLPALTALFHPYHRGLHDLAADSVMLRVGEQR